MEYQIEKKNSPALIFIAFFAFLLHFANAAVLMTNEPSVSSSQLFSNAASNLNDFSDAASEKVEEVLAGKIISGDSFLRLLDRNKSALDMFEQAIKQEPSAFVFAKKPERIDFDTPLPKFGPFIKLYKLMLLKGKIAEKDGRFDEAQESYFIAVKFISLLSMQEYPKILTSRVQVICMAYAYSQFDQSLKSNQFSADYKVSLLKILVNIQNHQDYLRSAFTEDAEATKGTVKAGLTDALNKGMTIDELLTMNTLGEKNTRSANAAGQTKIRKVKLTPEFIEEVSDQVTKVLDQFANAAVKSTQTGNIKLYQEDLKRFQDSALKMKNPLVSWMDILRKMIFERKKYESIIAGRVANIFVILSAPNYTKIIEDQFRYMGQLESLVAGFQTGNPESTTRPVAMNGKTKMFTLKSGKTIQGEVVFEGGSYFRVRKDDGTEQVIFTSDLAS